MEQKKMIIYSLHINMDSATKRKPNFSDREKSILINEYRSNLIVMRPQ